MKLIIMMTAMLFTVGVKICAAENLAETMSVNSVIDTTPQHTILPSTLLGFSVTIENQKANISWTVAENELALDFIVEKSLDGKHFTQIATLLPTTKDGSETYTYKDNYSAKTNVFYRIKLATSDFFSEYSKMILIKSKNENIANTLSLFKNPVTTEVVFNYSSTTNSTGYINIYTASGNIVYRSKTSLQKDMNTFVIPMDNKFVAGSYIIEVVNERELSITKFIKQ